MKTPYYGLYGYQVCKWYTDIHAGKILIYTNERKELCTRQKAQAAKRLPCTHEDLNLIPQQPQKKAGFWWCMLIILAMGARSLKFLASQPTSSAGGQ